MKVKTKSVRRAFKMPLMCNTELSRLVYRSALFLALTHNAAHAQIVNTRPIVNQIDTMTRQIERITEPVRQRTLETVADTAESAANVLDDATNGVANLDPLAALPLSITINNREGTAVFNDVAVEDGWRAVDRQWLVMIQDDELPTLQQPGIEILEETYLADLDVRLLRFSVSDELNSRRALRDLLPPSLVERLDRNHIYSPQKDNVLHPAAQTSNAGSDKNLALSAGILCENPLRIGMVDTAIQLDHPAFATKTIIEKDFLGNKFDHPHGHGTAVAGILIGNNEQLAARLPNAQLYNASVFYSRDQYAQGATMMHLVKGLNWLVENNVSVINMSLTGPNNQILARLVRKVIAKGKLIVAAAGNEGPAAPPVFPAAYDDVISVTAVDNNQKIYRWANQGDFIDFSAIGVSVLTTRSGGATGHESGTSMAAPTVTAYVACELANSNGKVDDIIERLAKKAEDLGHTGRDPIYGYGFLR